MVFTDRRGYADKLHCVTEIQQRVANTSDQLGLHSTVPTLVLEVQSLVGAIAAATTEATERGRRPFREPPNWEWALGTLGFALFNLADQTGTDLVEAISKAVVQMSATLPRSEDNGWPFTDN